VLSAEGTNVNRVSEGGKADEDKEDGQEFHFESGKLRIKL